MEANKKKIEQFFKGQEYSFQELVDNIDNIEDFEVQVEEQVIEEKIEKGKKAKEENEEKKIAGDD